jgi:hypothetical protein
LKGTLRAESAVHLMATASIQMDIHFVSFVTLGKVETIQITQLQPPMYKEWNNADSHNVSREEASLKESAKNTESLSMGMFYASIIETAITELLE